MILIIHFKHFFNIIIIFAWGILILLVMRVYLSFFEKKEYMEKIEKFNSAIKYIDFKDNSEEDIEFISQISAFKPRFVYLDNAKACESSLSNDRTVDSYAGCIVIPNTRKEDYVKYYLGGQYTRLTGKIAINNLSDKKLDCELMILCDDNIIYTTEDENLNIEPEEISISVGDC